MANGRHTENISFLAITRQQIVRIQQKWRANVEIFKNWKSKMPDDCHFNIRYTAIYFSVISDFDTILYATKQ